MDAASYTAYHKKFADSIYEQDAKIHYTEVTIITSYEDAVAFLTKSRCHNYAYLSFIDPSIADRELSKMACLKDSRSLLFVKAEFLDQAFFDEVFTPEHLQFMPFWAKEMWMCELACTWAGNYLYDVPYYMRTLELCQLAYDQNPRVFRVVPEGLRELLVEA
jgi:hypothetical protein